ncbi:condensation domain-containing protein, partial [Nocardia carnea]|uniref:condensation domain-containing protein n=1 Tax=Nocardia carnea TaxID=37328 RepID=UPI0032AF77BC
MPVLPFMSQILGESQAYRRFAQQMTLRLPADIDRESMIATLSALFDHHDALRARVGERDGSPVFEVLPPGAIDIGALIHTVELDDAIDDAELTRIASAELDAALGRLDPVAPAMAQFVWFSFAGERRDVLLFAAHHFVIDGVSWRVIIPDLALAWSQLAAG